LADILEYSFFGKKIFDRSKFSRPLLFPSWQKEQRGEGSPWHEATEPETVPSWRGTSQQAAAAAAAAAANASISSRPTPACCSTSFFRVSRLCDRRVNVQYRTSYSWLHVGSYYSVDTALLDRISQSAVLERRSGVID